MSDGAAGAIILVTALVVLCLCLILIVKVLNSVLQGDYFNSFCQRYLSFYVLFHFTFPFLFHMLGQIAVIIKKTLNAKIPYVPWITGYITILVGAVMTFLVQSSSVFTSALTPLVGLGVLSVERTYPLTLGSNIGTTTTALMASMAVEGDKFKASMQVKCYIIGCRYKSCILTNCYITHFVPIIFIQIALCHLLFNITGILIFYPIPFMRFPIPMAKFLGDTTAKYRWFAIIYMVLMFIVVPGVFMGLSFAGTPYVIALAAIIISMSLFVMLVNLLRQKKPSVLPNFLLSWKWLPIWCRSLQPYDELFNRFTCCRKLKEKNLDYEGTDVADQEETRLDGVSIVIPVKGNVNPGFVPNQE
jgi:sodium-dependent phosphate cotransporter